MSPTFQKVLCELADRRVIISAVAVVLSLGTAFGMPASRQNQVSNIIIAINVLAASVVAGMSYQSGKAIEGTVPTGSKSVNDVTVYHVGADAASLPPEAQAAIAAGAVTQVTSTTTVTPKAEGK